MVKFNSTWLIDERQFRSLTGVDADTFRKMVEQLCPYWRERIVAPKGYLGATMAVHSSIAFAGAFLGPLVFGIALDLNDGGSSPTSWGIAFMIVGVIGLAGPVMIRWLGKAG